MKRGMSIFLCAVIAFWIVAEPVYSAESASFGGFYKESGAIGWIIAGIAALIAGSVIFFTGGTASPIVVGIGTYIGNMAGLYGIAATNYGLALLGGGSIASGGFGIAGGVAVLTLALSFGTDVAIDYTVSKIHTAYSYSQFIEQSKKMTTLPLPKNDDGPDLYEEAMEVLEGINKKKGYATNHNQRVIRNAIRRMDSFSMDALSIGEKARVCALYSLLYFLRYDYPREARKYAQFSMNYSSSQELRRTLPAFIYAVCSLYEEKFDFDMITNKYFRYSVLAEPDNGLIPLMFAIYLDRMMYRFNDGALKENALRRLSRIAGAEEIREYAVSNFTIILMRYFVRLKICQQQISSLCESENTTIKNSRKTLFSVKSTLAEYDNLLEGGNWVIRKLLFSDLELEDEERRKTRKLYSLLNKYRNDQERLKSHISELEEYQKHLPKHQAVQGDHLYGYNYLNYGSDNPVSYVINFIFVTFCCFFVLKFKKPSKSESAVQKRDNLFKSFIIYIAKILSSLILISGTVIGGHFCYISLTNQESLSFIAVSFSLLCILPLLCLFLVWRKK